MGPTINLKIGRRELAKAWARRLRRGVGGGGGGEEDIPRPLTKKKGKKDVCPTDTRLVVCPEDGKVCLQNFICIFL